MASPVVKPEDVLETLMSDGTFDAIRFKILNKLKANEKLKSKTMKTLEERKGKVLNAPGAEEQTKWDLFDSLRRELENSPVLEKASKAAWELILDDNGLGKEISDIVERAYCRLSGLEPPPSSQSSIVEHQENKDKGEDKVKEGGTSTSSARKRSFGEVSMQDGATNCSNGH